MKIDYLNILNKNMINVFKDILLNIEKNGLQENHQLYITFNTKIPKVEIPDWLSKKFPKEMTIVIQYEYWDLNIKKDSFSIGLSFNEIKSNLKIPYNSIISFLDPYAKFGLTLNSNIDREILPKKKQNKINIKNKSKNNVIDFTNYKKN